VDLSAQGILKIVQAFRKTKWFNILVLVVLGLVATGLWALTAAGPIGECLGVLLIPVSVFVIPYWLGERRMKTFALNIIPVFIIAVVLIAALQTQSILSQGDPTLSSGIAPNTATADLPPLSLWNGTVAPFGAPSANQTYAYHVRLKMVGNVNRSTVSVYLNITQVSGLSENFVAYRMHRDLGPLNTNTTNGTWYVIWHTLTPGIYGFYFFASDTGTNQSYSSGVLGPIIQPWPDWYGFVFLFSAVNLIFPISFYFVILFMYWYTLRNRRMRARLIESSRAEKTDTEKGSAGGKRSKEAKEGAGPPAPTREKSRKAAAFTCTNCGADVTEADQKCPKCGAVFED
jgi:hypothetical protein